MSISDDLLEHSVTHRAWQNPFARQRFVPVRGHDRVASEEVFEPAVYEHYLRGMGVTLWNRVYFKGRART